MRPDLSRIGVFGTAILWILAVPWMALASEVVTPVVHIAPVASGDRDGRDWANAGGLSELATLATPGSHVRLRADQGPYRIDRPIELRRGGSAAHPTQIEGVTAEGAPMRAVLVGGRASPYDPRGDTGPEVFRILTGANHLRFRGLSFRDQGHCIRFAGDVSNIAVTDSDAKNVRRFIENEHTGEAATATVSDLVVRNVQIHGFSKEAIRLRYDTHDVLIEDVLGDSERQDGDDFAEGIALDGTAHDVVLRRVTMRNAHDSQNRFWNGDGFSTELGNYRIRFEDTVALGNTDAGYDLKSSDTILIRAGASDNATNFKFWGRDITVRDCIGIAPFKRGGSGGQSQVQAVTGASVTMTGCRLTDNDPTSVTFLVDAGASLTAIGTAIVRHESSRLADVSATGTIRLEP